jgi:hypothetical protein
VKRGPSTFDSRNEFPLATGISTTGFPLSGDPWGGDDTPLSHFSHSRSRRWHFLKTIRAMAASGLAAIPSFFQILGGKHHETVGIEIIILTLLKFSIFHGIVTYGKSQTPSTHKII